MSGGIYGLDGLFPRAVEKWYHLNLESGKFSKPTYVGVCGTLEPQDMGVGDVEMTQKLLKTPNLPESRSQ